MTTQQHLITPAAELVQKWASSSPIQYSDESWAYELFIAHQAARWGADQQLQLDAKWLDHNALNETHLKITPIGDVLKEAMRPKPPSLKEQALKELEQIMDELHEETGSAFTASTIRRALEALPND